MGVDEIRVDKMGVDKVGVNHKRLLMHYCLCCWFSTSCVIFFAYAHFMPMQYTPIYGCKDDYFRMNHDIFLIFVLNEDEVLLTSAHNLCFGAKNKKNDRYPCKPILIYKRWVWEDLNYVGL